MNIVCIKWSDKFSHDHVNRLYKMVSKHIDDFTFTCYTEDSTNINPNITIAPLNLDYQLENWWWKLCLFEKPTDDITIFFDLDVVIQNDITHFKNYCNGKIRLVKAYWKSYKLKDLDMNYNSSVMIWKGDHTDIWKKFYSDPEYYMALYNGIDSFLYYNFKEKLDVFPKGEIYSRLYGVDEKDFWKPGTPRKKLYKKDNYSICIFNGWRRDTEITNGKYTLDDDGYNGYELYWN